MSKIEGFYQLREMFSGEVDEELRQVAKLVDSATGLGGGE